MLWNAKHRSMSDTTVIGKDDSIRVRTDRGDVVEVGDTSMINASDKTAPDAFPSFASLPLFFQIPFRLAATKTYLALRYNEVSD
ncbi:hypothetical protein HZH68_004047 [Vespula germanica]|uniref:Uncharacterized protein n=1 Tax=Vespula germanica TaxID=30212 RepID=A0A834KT55_VESGE|nr:hypothetical protein HZH68_004047 [Vespula germanica]